MVAPVGCSERSCGCEEGRSGGTARYHPNTSRVAPRIGQKHESDANKLDEAAGIFSSEADQLATCSAAVADARGSLAAHKASAVVPSASTSGPCMTAFNDSLAFHGMSMTRYWMGKFMGGDCRKFAENRLAILAMVRDKINELFGEAKATEFYNRHCGILEQLNIIGHHTRRVAMLSPAQIEELRVSCREYGGLFRGPPGGGAMVVGFSGLPIRIMPFSLRKATSSKLI